MSRVIYVTLQLELEKFRGEKTLINLIQKKHKIHIYGFRCDLTRFHESSSK